LETLVQSSPHVFLFTQLFCQKHKNPYLKKPQKRKKEEEEAG